MTKHVMLDIETLGKGSYAAIWTIGAVKFNPRHCPETVEELMDTTERFHVRVEGAGCNLGLQTDMDTIKWWMGKDREAARESILAMPGVDIFEALHGFTEWYGTDPNMPVWGNGATFDNVITSNAYGRASMLKPWSYKADRCFRTLKELFPSVPKEDVGTAHGALDDALAQTWWLQRIVKQHNIVAV